MRKAVSDQEFKRKMTERGETLRYLPPHEYGALWDAVDAQLVPLIEIAKRQGQ